VAQRHCGLHSRYRGSGAEEEDEEQEAAGGGCEAEGKLRAYLRERKAADEGVGRAPRAVESSAAEAQAGEDADEPAGGQGGAGYDGGTVGGGAGGGEEARHDEEAAENWRVGEGAAVTQAGKGPEAAAGVARKTCRRTRVRVRVRVRGVGAPGGGLRGLSPTLPRRERRQRQALSLLVPGVGEEREAPAFVPQRPAMRLSGRKRTG